MKLPRDLSGDELVKLLAHLGYQITRQTGSHVRLTRPGEHEHHITVPRHQILKVGTLHNILKDVATHLGTSVEELIESLKG